MGAQKISVRIKGNNPYKSHDSYKGWPLNKFWEKLHIEPEQDDIPVLHLVAASSISFVPA